MIAGENAFDRDGAILVSREIDDLLLQARGLVLVRPILSKRGATDHELDAHTSELERLRRQLADLIRGQRS